MSQRIVIAGMLHETNTFSPVATPLGAFFSRARPPAAGVSPLIVGQEALDLYEQVNVGFAGFLSVARAAGVEVVAPLYANASPSAPTSAADYDIMADAIVAAVSAGCDAVMLDLHGAMVAEGIDDGEAELLRRIRQVAPDVPIAVALDFHANISPELVAGADVITGYRTYPHVDMAQTGERAGRTLMAMLAGEITPVMRHGWLPMLTHMNRHSPQFQPMRDLMNLAIEQESSRQVLNASIFGGFPLADIPWAGFSVVVVADAGRRNGRLRSRRERLDDTDAASVAAAATAQALIDQLCGQAWERRAEFIFEIEPLAQTVSRARSIRQAATDRDRAQGVPRKPIVLADHSNNTASGGSVDTMESVAEVLAQGLTGVIAGPICDPQAVAELIAAGVGAERTLAVGGRVDAPSIGRTARPLTLKGRVRTITDGSFRVRGPMMTGALVNCGRTVVFDTGPLSLVIAENRAEPFDLGVFTHCGLDPLAADYIILWSRQHFRAGFEPIAEQVLMMAGPGVCSSDYSQFPFKRIQRPIYPLDTTGSFSDWRTISRKR